MVKAVLRWVWDPIGVRGIPEASGEYDDYAAAVLKLLDHFSTDEEIAAYLNSVEIERMGLLSHGDRNEDVAALLRELHALVP
jgi:hypothetical protein